MVSRYCSQEEASPRHIRIRAAETAGQAGRGDIRGRPDRRGLRGSGRGGPQLRADSEREAQERTQGDESHLSSFGNLQPDLSHSFVTDSEGGRFRDSKLLLDIRSLDAADASIKTLWYSNS